MADDSTRHANCGGAARVPCARQKWVTGCTVTVDAEFSNSFCSGKASVTVCILQVLLGFPA